LTVNIERSENKTIIDEGKDLKASVYCGIFIYFAADDSTTESKLTKTNNVQ
jgi:hypothetical protein